MNRKTSLILSVLFHPVLMPVIAMGLMIFGDPIVHAMLSPKMTAIMLSLVFLLTVLGPLVMVYLIYRLGLIRSFYMRSRDERAIPLLVIALFYYLTYYLLKGMYLPQLFHMYMLGATLMIIILIVFNFFRMVSLHMAGIGALTGLFFFYLSFEFTIVSCLPLMTELLPSARATLMAFNVSALAFGRAIGAFVAPRLYGLGFLAVALGAIGLNLLALLAVIRLGKERQHADQTL